MGFSSTNHYLNFVHQIFEQYRCGVIWIKWWRKQIGPSKLPNRKLGYISKKLINATNPSNIIYVLRVLIRNQRLGISKLPAPVEHLRLREAAAQNLSLIPAKPFWWNRIFKMVLHEKWSVFFDDFNLFFDIFKGSSVQQCCYRGALHNGGKFEDEYEQQQRFSRFSQRQKQYMIENMNRKHV